MPTDTRTLQTDAWRLDIPKELSADSPLICIPTVHPRGDRRIVSCAQVALDAGYRVHFIWLGDGEASADPLVSESILPAPRSTRDRLLMVGRVASDAANVNADAWHIHDFYMLSQAKRWHAKTARPVIYDVHEYYAEYYPARLPLPRLMRRWVGRAIEAYQTRAAKTFGGANVVAERMSAPFVARGVRVAVSPNYPRLGPLQDAEIKPFATRAHRVLHMGTLTTDYGSRTLIALAARSQERGLPFEFAAVGRFPSLGARRAFTSEMRSAGVAIEMLEPRAAHEMPGLLSEYGFGLSLLVDDGGQNERAVPAKNTEHILMGLVAVVTNRRAQRDFVEASGCAIVVDETDIDDALDRMEATAADASIDGRLRAAAIAGRQELTWEGRSAPQIASLYRRVLGHVLSDEPEHRA